MSGVDFSALGNSFGIGPQQNQQHEYVASSLDLFSKPEIETVMLYSRENVSTVQGSLNDDGPYTFHIPAEGNMYTDPAGFMLEGEISVSKISATTQEKTDITSSDTVRLVNLWPYAMFRNVEVAFEGVGMSYMNSANAHYKAYLETMLSYSSDASKTHLLTSRFKMDTAGNFNDTTLDDDLKKQKKLDFMISLHSDILRIDRFLPDKLAIDVTLTRSPDKLVVMADDTTAYKITLHKLRLHYRKIQLQGDFIDKVNKKMLAGTKTRFPLTRSVVKTRAIPTGTSTIVLSDVFNGNLPNTIVFGLVKSLGYAGQQSENPFYFRHFNITGVNLIVNSKQYPSVRYSPNFTSESERLMRVYRCLLNNIGVNTSNTGPLVTFDLFKRGCTLFAFDLTPDMCGEFHKHIQDKGSIALELSFSRATTYAATAVIYSSFHDEFQLDSDRIAYSTGLGKD